MEIFNVLINVLILIVDVLILTVLVKDDKDMLRILKELSSKPNTALNDTALKERNDKIDQKINELIKELFDL